MAAPSFSSDRRPDPLSLAWVVDVLQAGGALEAGPLQPPARQAAIDIWQATRATISGHDPRSLYMAYFAALKERQLAVPAQIVADALGLACPDDLWPKPVLAAFAGQAGDHARALAIGKQIIAGFPASPDGPRIALAALFVLGRNGAAEKLLAGLPPGFEDEEWHLAAALRLGIHAADHDRLLVTAARLRTLSPRNPLGYHPAIIVLRGRDQFDAAEAIVVQGLETCPGSAEILKQAALVAQDRKQEDLAYTRWEAMRARFPALAAGHVGAVKLSLALQQPATTERLLVQALAAFPENRDLLTAAARHATRARRWKEAASHWQAVIDLSPGDPAVRLQAAMSIMGPQGGRQKRMPDVLRRLAALHEDYPEYAPAYAAHLNALREARRSADAEPLGAAWAERFPGDAPLAIARARVAEDLARPADALACLRAARAVCAPSAPLEAAFIRALCLAGDVEEAEPACAAALARFPNHVAILGEFVDLATRRGDWKQALERAELAIRRRPNEDSIRAHLRRARAQILDGSVQDGAPPPADGDGDGADTGEFFKGFESLGATSAGCEFGLVQRRFGAEPFGLMRWAKIRVEGLIEALLTQFAGMGLEENTQLLVQRTSADHSEYFVQDSRLGYWTHTFVKAEDAPFDRMYKQSVRRVQFLRAKLLEDLQAGDKIYTFKWTRDVDHALLRRLFAALKTYGEDCTLLCVTLADAAHPKNMLEMLEHGLFLGRTNSFMDTGIKGAHGVDTEQWRAFCERVAAWRRETPKAAAS